MLRWNPVLYHPKEFAADTPIGRYLIKREHKGSRTFRLYHNGMRTVYSGNIEDCKQAAERAISSHQFKNVTGKK